MTRHQSPPRGVRVPPPRVLAEHVADGVGVTTRPVLVPEKHDWAVFGGGGADVWLSEPGVRRLGDTYAATPAIALCIASLKARSSADGR